MSCSKCCKSKCCCPTYPKPKPKCPSGPSGPQGGSGPSGPSGPCCSGPSGPQGLQGLPGLQGGSGPSGPCCSGPSGPQGRSGPSGPQGGSGTGGKLVQNVYQTVIQPGSVTPGPPAIVTQLNITPTPGNRLRYRAWAQLAVDTPAGTSFEILDAVQQGSPIVVAGQSYPTIVGLRTLDTVSIEWEVEPAVGGLHTVSLTMQTTAGLLEVLEAYLSVDEISP